MAKYVAKCNFHAGFVKKDKGEEISPEHAKQMKADKKILDYPHLVEEIEDGKPEDKKKKD